MKRALESTPLIISRRERGGIPAKADRNSSPGYRGGCATTAGQAQATRAEYREKFPQEVEHGFLSGFTGEFQQPCDAAGYPPGFHSWPLERRNAWWAGANLGYIEGRKDDQAP
jgi:hypothetical protein